MCPAPRTGWRGHAQTGTVLTEVAAAGVALVDVVTGPERIASAVAAVLPGGRRVYQHVILHLRDACTERQVDVGAWN